MAAIEKLESSQNQSKTLRLYVTVPRHVATAHAHVSNQRYEENTEQNCSKQSQIPHLWTVQCMKTLSVVSVKYYCENLQAVVKICQIVSSKLSVFNSANQMLIPLAGNMERRHQWNVYRLSCTLLRHQTDLSLPLDHKNRTQLACILT